MAGCTHGRRVQLGRRDKRRHVGSALALQSKCERCADVMRLGHARMRLVSQRVPAKMLLLGHVVLGCGW
jgi:hypothetical protein